MDATLHIGKDGLEKVVDEVDDQLEARGEIKIKVNPSIIEGRMKKFTENMARKLADQVDAEIVWVKGRTMVLRRD